MERRGVLAARAVFFKDLFRRALPFLGLMVVAIGLQFVEYPYQRREGNMCDGPGGWCYEPGWKLGVPFAWWHGSKVSSYVGSSRDELFILNIVICASFLFYGYVIWHRKKMWGAVRLIEPSVEYKQTFLEAMREFQAKKDGTSAYEEGIDLAEAEADFPLFIQQLLDKQRGVGLVGSTVPATTLWLVRGREFLGRVSIRHQLNDRLINSGGHIGYSIRPTRRNMGYGTKALELAIPEARRLGIEKMLLTCNESNIASRRIIEKNGGILEDIREVDGLQKRRYWIH